MTSTFAVDQPWALHERVSLRRESFGALAYHFGTRRLSFLKHPLLVSVLEALDEHETARDACRAAGVRTEMQAAVQRALGTLADTGMIVPRRAPNPVEGDGVCTS